MVIFFYFLGHSRTEKKSELFRTGRGGGLLIRRGFKNLTSGKLYNLCLQWYWSHFIIIVLCLLFLLLFTITTSNIAYNWL